MCLFLLLGGVSCECQQVELADNLAQVALSFQSPAHCPTAYRERAIKRFKNIWRFTPFIWPVFSLIYFEALSCNTADWKKITSSHLSDKGLISRLYEEFSKHIHMKTTNQIKRWAENLNRRSIYQDIEMTNHRIKTFEKLIIIHWGMQNKT